MSVDSLSDGEPMFSSPEPSDDEIEPSLKHDVFKFTARKFQRVDKTDSSPCAMHHRRRYVDTVEEKITLLERKDKARHDKLQGRQKSNFIADLSSDEEDDGNGVMKNRSSAKIASLKVLEIGQGSTQSRSAIALDSDDDDSDYDDLKPAYVAFKDAPEEVLEALRRSQMAAARLQQAQSYHAEDVDVPVEVPDYFAPSQTTIRAATLQSFAPTKPVKLGEALRLSCRCQIKLNGSKRPTEVKDIIIYQNQQLSSLKEKVMSTFSLPPSARVSLTFDGMSLDLSRTVRSYEIEDEDLIDAAASVIVVPKMNSTAISSGPRISLTLRCKVGKQVKETPISMGKNEALKTILEQYKKNENYRGNCKFNFDGQMIDMERTPATYQLEDGDLIDVVRTR